jgi:hypothetical protein
MVERVELMSAAYADRLQGRDPVKICTFPGCVGTMKFHARRWDAAEEHTREWPWYATWVCQSNPGHIQVATPAEERMFAGRSDEAGR